MSNRALAEPKLRSRLKEVLAIGEQLRLANLADLGDDTGVRNRNMYKPYQRPERPTVPSTSELQYIQRRGLVERVAAAVDNGNVCYGVDRDALTDNKGLDLGSADNIVIGTDENRAKPAAWWQQWQAMAEKRWLGQGAWNQAWLVPTTVDAFDQVIPMFKDVYESEPPALGLIVRIGKKPERKLNVVSEMITACYAQAAGIGPRVYAQWYYNEAPANELSQDQIVSIAALQTKGGLNDTVKWTASVTEAWSGDCEAIVTVPPAIDADEFAKKFVGLCMRAADAGLWHMDIKRANTLYRTLENDDFDLCFTDFDSFFCVVLSEEERKDKRDCCIATTAACFLAELRCKVGVDVWRRYAVPMGNALLQTAGIDLNNMKTARWCAFLSSAPVRDASTLRGKELEMNKLAEAFQLHLMNYFDTDMRGRPCFIRDTTPGASMFSQIVDFTILNASE